MKIQKPGKVEQPENLQFVIEAQEEQIKALTDRAEKAEEQFGALLGQLNDLRDIKDEIMAERDTYKAIIRAVEALTGKEILIVKKQEDKWLV